MELSPEDRDRIFQEEKARHEAQQRLRAEEKNSAERTRQKGCLGFLGVVVLVGIVIALMPGLKTSKEDTEAAVMKSAAQKSYAGRAATVASDSTGVCFPSYRLLDRFVKASGPPERLEIMKEASTRPGFVVLGIRNPLAVSKVEDGYAEVQWRGVGVASRNTGRCWISADELEVR